MVPDEESLESNASTKFHREPSNSALDTSV